MREVEELDVAQLCGQLLVVGFDGAGLPDTIAENLESLQLGGVILFSRNTPSVESAWRICHRIRRVTAATGFPPFVSIDQEGGRVRRLKTGLLQAPPMRALGEADDAALTREFARTIARQLAAVGFNLNFAPVADVDSNPDNPIIGDRAFSSSPTTVTRHARIAVQEFQANGTIACIKHFPGHGDTTVDSHLALPKVSKSSVDLRRVEMYPFERLVKDSLALMTAHVVFEAFDDLPATLSPRLLCDLLRREFSFDGVVFSDDLEMAALNDHHSIEESVVRAIEAGCDTLLICRSASLQERAHRALVERADTDDEFRKRCVQAVARSLKLRRQFPIRPVSSLEELEGILATPRSQQLQQRLDGLSST